MAENFDLVNPEGRDDLLAIQKDKYEAALKALITGRTPKRVVYQKPAGGEKEVDYIPGWWFIDQLNSLFSYNWDFEIVNQGITGDQIWVLGKLTVHTSKGTIVKMAFGGVRMKSVKNAAIDIGDDYKTAATDSLKKAATFLGLGADIYGRREGQEDDGVKETTSQTEMKKLYRIGTEKGLTKEQVDAKVREDLHKEPDDVTPVDVLRYMNVLRQLPEPNG